MNNESAAPYPGPYSAEEINAITRNMTCCGEFIVPMPSGTFIMCGRCKKCRQWYDYESGFGSRGFFRHEGEETDYMYQQWHRYINRGDPR